MKIVLLCEDDFANAGYEYGKSLEAVGHKVRMWKKYPHPFQYSKEMTVAHPSAEGLIRCSIREADLVFTIQTVPFLQEFVLPGTPQIIHHGGIRYYANLKDSHDFWGPRTLCSIAETPNLLHMGAKNPHLCMSSVDTETLTPAPPPEFPTIGHFPTTDRKGTPEIVKVLADFPQLNPFIKPFSIQLPHDLLITLLRNCLFYIDQISPTLIDGIEGGLFGVVVREAASLGRISLTNLLRKDDYEQTYGQTPLIITNTPEELRQGLLFLLSLSPEELQAKQKDFRDWAVRCHSRKATGLLLNTIFSHYMDLK